MSNVGTCDLCNSQINCGPGYLFYSDTLQPGNIDVGDIGIMHLCNRCTDTYINDDQFQRNLPIMSMTREEFASDLDMGIKYLQEANALGIIRTCKIHGLTVTQSKSKGHGFALMLWEDKERCIRKATEFWKSTLALVYKLYKKTDTIPYVCWAYDNVNVLPSFWLIFRL